MEQLDEAGRENYNILDYEEEFNDFKSTEALKEEDPAFKFKKFVKQEAEPDVDITIQEYYSEDSMVKLQGPVCKDGKYTKVYVVGDTRIRPLKTFWQKTNAAKYPSLISIKNMTLQKVMNVVLSQCQFPAGGKNLLILSLGLHDLIEFKAVEASRMKCTNYNHPFVSYEITDPDNSSIANKIINSMKELKHDLAKKSIDVVFTDIFKVDLQRMQDFQLLTNDCRHCKNFSLDENTLRYDKRRLKEILGLVHDEMVKNDLNGIKVQSSKWIFFDDYNEDYLGADGINLNQEASLKFARSVSKLCSYLFRAKRNYEEKEAKPLIKEEKTNEPPPNAYREYRTYKRVIIAGDRWLDPVVEMWPKYDEMKPTFAVLCKSGVDEIMDKLEAKYDLNNTLLVISIGTNDLFDYVEHDACDNHKPLKFPVVQNDLLKSPSAFAGKLWAKLFNVRNRISKKYTGTHIIYLTLYPLNLLSYHNYLIESHAEKHNHVLPALIDKITQSRIVKNLPVAFQQVNMWINEHSQTNLLPTWGINKILNVKGSDKTIVFPEVPVKVSVANKVITKFKTLIEQSNPLDDSVVWKEDRVGGRRFGRGPDRFSNPRPLIDKEPASDINQLYIEHQWSIKRYKKDPKSHPKYLEEKQVFMDIQKMQGSATDMDLEREWNKFWPVKLTKIFEEEWQEKEKEFNAKNPNAVNKMEGKGRMRDNEGSDFIKGPEGPSSAKRQKRSDFGDHLAAAQVFESIKLLTEIADKLGSLEMPIKLWFEKVQHLQKKNMNPLVLFDKDGKLILNMINDKLTQFIYSGELGVVQQVIVENILNKIGLLFNIIECFERDFYGVDIQDLGNSTKGFSESDIRDYIKAFLSSNGCNSIKDLERFCATVAAYHASLEVEGQFASVHGTNQFCSQLNEPNNSNFQGMQSNFASSIRNRGRSRGGAGSGYGMNFASDAAFHEDDFGLNSNFGYQNFGAKPSSGRGGLLGSGSSRGMGSFGSSNSSARGNSNSSRGQTSLLGRGGFGRGSGRGGMESSSGSARGGLDSKSNRGRGGMGSSFSESGSNFGTNSPRGRGNSNSSGRGGFGSPSVGGRGGFAANSSSNRGGFGGSSARDRGNFNSDNAADDDNFGGDSGGSGNFGSNATRGRGNLSNSGRGGSGTGPVSGRGNFGGGSAAGRGGFGSGSAPTRGGAGVGSTGGRGGGFGSNSGNSNNFGSGGFGSTSTSAGGFGSNSNSTRGNLGSNSNSSGRGGFGSGSTSGRGSFGSNTTPSNRGNFGSNSNSSNKSNFGSSSASNRGGFGKNSSSGMGGFRSNEPEEETYESNISVGGGYGVNSGRGRGFGSNSSGNNRGFGSSAPAGRGRNMGPSFAAGNYNENNYEQNAGDNYDSYGQDASAGADYNESSNYEGYDHTSDNGNYAQNSSADNYNQSSSGGYGHNSNANNYNQKSSGTGYGSAKPQSYNANSNTQIKPTNYSSSWNKSSYGSNTAGTQSKISSTNAYENYAGEDNSQASHASNYGYNEQDNSNDYYANYSTNDQYSSTPTPTPATAAATTEDHSQWYGTTAATAATTTATTDYSYDQTGSYSYGYDQTAYSGYSDLSQFKDSGIPMEVLQKFQSYSYLDATDQENANKYLESVHAANQYLAAELTKLINASYGS